MLSPVIRRVLARRGLELRRVSSDPGYADLEPEFMALYELERTDAAGEQTRAVAGLDEVRANLAATGYPSDRLQFVEGMVEDTIPRWLPRRSAFSVSTPTGTSPLDTSCSISGQA